MYKRQLLLSDAGIENMLDGCDVVLRFGLPSDEGMVARKVATSEMLIVAAPSYLERHGHPAVSYTHLDVYKRQAQDVAQVTDMSGEPVGS